MARGFLLEAAMPIPYLPGEKRKRSLVTIEMDPLDAAIYAPAKLAALESRPSDLTDTLIVQDYIVSTRKLDGRFSHKVVIDGQEIELPHKVFQTLKWQVETIFREERSERGKHQAQVRKAQAGMDQECPRFPKKRSIRNRFCLRES